MTDQPRPNPLGLPLDPDPSLPANDPVDLPGRGGTERSIDDPVVWPGDQPESPDGRSLDLPGETSDAVDSGPQTPEPQPA